MTSLPPDIWEKLASSHPHGETLAARIAAPQVGERLLAALDAEGRRHFLIGVASDEPSATDKQSRGVHVETRDLTVPGRKATKYIDISCIDPAGHDVFQLVGAELGHRVQHGEEAAESVRRVLAKWRRFWGQLPKEMLSRNDQVGFLAELWFLLHWMIPLTSPGEAIRRWRGPAGARHDFEWPGTSVEVKATTAMRGIVHHINGIDQLVPPDNGILFLFSMRLREEAGASNSLPDLIAECRQSFESDSEAISGFETRLLQAGYSPAHDEEYSKLRLRVVDENLYLVGSGFPKIVPFTLVNGVPPGVEYVGYDIDLSGFDHLKVGRELLQQDHS